MEENKKLVEVAIWETRQKLWDIIKSNQLGAAINRLIFQEIADRLALEEQQIVKKAKTEKREQKGSGKEE